MSQAAPTTVASSPAAASDRLEWEAARLAEAEADVAAGRLVSLTAVQAWVESWDTDAELPPPSSCR